MRCRILIVDDHEVVRRGIRTLLSARSDWEICGEAADGQEAIEKAKALHPEVVLMDIFMPRMNGLDATRLLHLEIPNSKVIIVSQNDPRIVREQAHAIGAAAFVVKSDLAEKLVTTIDQVIGAVPSPSSAPAQPIASQSATGGWLAGGGGLGQLIREYDWSKTPLGAFDHWPQSLRTSVNLMLNSRHPMWIGWGPEMTFLYNDAYVAVLSQAKHPQALGRPAREVWSEIWDICGPLADKVFERGEATFVDDVRLFMSRGDVLEETYYSFSYSPIHDESGRVAGLFCPSTETTAKILNGRRLRTLSELAANAVVEKSTEAACASSFATLARNPDDVPFALLYLLDETHGAALLKQSTGISDSVERVSPSRIDLKSEPDDPPFWKIREVLNSCQPQRISLTSLESLPIGPAQQPVKEAIFLPVTSSGQNWCMGVLVAGVNPTRSVDSEYQTFFELVAGQVATIIQNARAAEEERKRVEALAEIDRAKTAFFSNVSHEFRTPLTLMLGPVEDLLSKSHTELSPNAKGQLELVNRNGSRLLRLVNTLLDFSRIEAGRMQAIYQPTDIARFTVDLASVFRSATEKAGLKLELNCPPLSEPVFIDRGMWEKIVLNLISNAFKFTFEGKIAVDLQQTGEYAELRVRDTGVGIPAEELPRIFERFHRIENTRSRTHEGSGIGLALVQELVKLHGGSFLVESTLGKGSTFIVRMPFGKEHLPADRVGGTRTLATTAMGAAPFVEEALRWLPDSTQKQPADEMPVSSEFLPVPYASDSHAKSESDKRPLILVADDNSDMRHYLSRLLGERYEVKSVADGQAALEAIRERQPALVLTDVMMPLLDGFGLLRELRSNPKTSSIPVILLSARAGEEARVEGIEQGADDYLIKPFSARELLARVHTHLELAHLRKENEDALRDKERRLRMATDAAELGIWHWYPAQDLATWENDRVYEMFRRPREKDPYTFTEFVTKVIHPEDAQAFQQAIAHTMNTGERFFFQCRVTRDDGTPAWLEFTAQVELAADGSPVRLLGTALDITTRKETEETLRQQRDRFDLVAQASQVGFWFCDLPFDKLLWDERVKEHFWLPPDADVTIDTFYEKIHPDDRERTRLSIAASITDRLPYDIEYRTVSSDGQRKWIRAIGQAFYDDAGNPRRFDGVTIETTERRRADAALRKMTAEAIASTAKFRAVFEQTSVFAGIMTVDGIILDANRLSLDACGYRDDEVLGKPFWECGWWRGSREVQERVRFATQQAASGIAFSEVLPYLWADGTERLVELGVHPIRDHEGQIIFLHPTGVDITVLKAAEENYRKLAETLEAQVHARTEELELRNIEVLKQSEQLRELSHRLMQIQDDERRHIARELHDSAGQILTALGMTLGRLAQHTSKDRTQFSSDVEEGQQLVRELSQEIRTTSYLLHPPLLDESGLSEALLWYIRGLKDRSGLDITLQISDDFGRLSHEMELVIFRIVQECLTNVHRHSGSKSAEISVCRDAQNVSLEVRDRGKGMSREELTQLQSRGGGVGIRGMRERVLQLGGEMTITSEGRGTTISVTLPVHKTSEPQAAEYGGTVSMDGLEWATGKQE